MATSLFCNAEEQEESREEEEAVYKMIINRIYQFSHEIQYMPSTTLLEPLALVHILVTGI